MQNTVAINDIAGTALVDIRSVAVDKELPREERIAESNGARDYRSLTEEFLKRIRKMNK